MVKLRVLFPHILMSVLSLAVTDKHWCDAKDLCVCVVYIGSFRGHELDFRLKLAPSVYGTGDAIERWQDVPKRLP